MTRLKHSTVAAILLVMALSLAACGGRAADAAALPADDPVSAVVAPERVEPEIVADVLDSEPVTTVDTAVASVAEADVEPVADMVTDNAESGYMAVLFAIEPLGAPCCPKPTPDKALAGAQGVAGVMDARLIDDFTVFVRFDPGATDQGAVASGINQAAFLVTEKVATPDELAALALVTDDENGESN